jgi:hypothetical protein
MKEETKDNIWTAILILSMFGYLVLAAIYLK